MRSDPGLITVEFTHTKRKAGKVPKALSKYIYGPPDFGTRRPSSAITNAPRRKKKMFRKDYMYIATAKHTFVQFMNVLA